MKKWYRTAEDVLRSPLASITSAKHEPKSDRVFKSTRLEDQIYADLRAEDDTLTELEQISQQKLSSFPALSRDVFQSFYSLLPRRNDPNSLSVAAQKFHTKILEHVMQDEDYGTLKTICEGRELPAYEAATEFISRSSSQLDDLMADIGGKENSLNTLQKLTDAQQQAEQELAELLQRMQTAKEHNSTLEQEIIQTANRLESKTQQVEAVSKLIDTSSAQHKAEISAVIAAATKAASEKAEEVQNIIGAWSDAPADLERNPVNTALLETVRSNETLQQVAKYLGRFREIIAQGKRNGYAYGRGEKYSLELGNDLSRAISSEFAMLASPQTVPLFLKKYQQKQLKQYRRREPIHKGHGDIICCLDESGSTRGDPAAWGKAVALALLDIAAGNGRKFALIHFASYDSCRVDVFLPGQYTIEDKMNAAEVFLGGGTNFERPMQEAIGLMENEGFENADIVFITDGECALSEEYLEALHRDQAERKFKVTGVLLDTKEMVSGFSLEPFCQQIYRTSQFVEEDIVQNIISQRI